MLGVALAAPTPRESWQRSCTATFGIFLQAKGGGPREGGGGERERQAHADHRDLLLNPTQLNTPPHQNYRKALISADPASMHCN